MKHVKALAAAAMAVVLMSVAPTASAGRDFGSIYTDCGLGGLMAQHSAGWAVSTNITWDLGTTAITSEMSSPDSCHGGKAVTAMIIYEAFPSIETELAQGRGEHLDALFTLAGRDQVDHARLIAALRAEFAKQVAASDYSTKTRYEKSEALYDAFQVVTASAS